MTFSVDPVATGAKSSNITYGTSVWPRLSSSRTHAPKQNTHVVHVTCDRRDPEMTRTRKTSATPGTGKPLVPLNSSHDLLSCWSADVLILIQYCTSSCLRSQTTTIQYTRNSPPSKFLMVFSLPPSGPLYPHTLLLLQYARPTRPQKKKVQSSVASLSLTASPKEFRECSTQKTR